MHRWRPPLSHHRRTHHRRAFAAFALITVTALTPGLALAQSPSPVPPVGPDGTPLACPAVTMTAATAPIHDPAAVLALAFAAPNPDTTVGGWHPGEDWTGPDSTLDVPVFAIGDGRILAVEPATAGGHDGLVVVEHTGPFAVPASTAGAPYAYAASTEATILSVYAGVTPDADLVAGGCADEETPLGTATTLHLELRTAATADPALRAADWSVAGTAEDSTDGWFHDAQRMVDAGLREPSAFLASLPAPDPVAGLDGLLGADGRLTVLLLGSDHFDAACTERGDLAGERTDTIMFATINPANGKVSMASLPRDTISVPIGPGEVYGPKVTGLFESLLAGSGGNRKRALTKMVAAMEAFSGVEIDYYGLTYFCGVKDVVDALGGIDVTLSSPLIDPTMHIGKHGLKLKAGKHHLDGGHALAFARSRHSDSDYARARRQQQVIVAVLQRLEEKGIEALPALVGLATEKVAKKLTRFQTDFPIEQAPALWALLGQAKLASVKSTVLAPPSYETEGTGDQLYSNIPDMAAIRAYFARVFGPVTP